MLYRLYLDESGDHTNPTNATGDAAKRYFALVGVWFPRQGSIYDAFARALEQLKRTYLPRTSGFPPVVLHRKALVDGSGAFSSLADPALRRAFENDLLRIMGTHEFIAAGIVIDKLAPRRVLMQPRVFRPYHYCVDILLRRYCGYLQRLGHRGDVMGESRGRLFDEELKEAYRATYQGGAYVHDGTFLGHLSSDAIQSALTSREIKLKPKSANIPGLQLAEVLALPVKLDVLAEFGVLKPPQGFAGEVCRALRDTHKYYRQQHTQRVRGYGMILYPR